VFVFDNINSTMNAIAFYMRMNFNFFNRSNDVRMTAPCRHNTSASLHQLDASEPGRRPPRDDDSADTDDHRFSARSDHGRRRRRFASTHPLHAPTCSRRYTDCRQPVCVRNFGTHRATDERPCPLGDTTCCCIPGRI